jgi:hypothetical protein
MNSRLTLAVIALSMPASLAAQATAQVNIAVPVNVKQVGPDVGKLKVTCTLVSDAFTSSTTGVITTATTKSVEKTQEVSITGGMAMITAALSFSVDGMDNPVGKQATIDCALAGWSTSGQGWVPFDPGSQYPSFRSTAQIPHLTSSFVW